MKHLLLFESFGKAIQETDAAKALDTLFSDAEHTGKPLVANADTYLNDIVKSICHAQQNTTVREAVVRYLNFLAYALESSRLDLRTFLNTEKKWCITTPYPLYPSDGLGKQLLSGVGIDKDDKEQAILLVSFLQNDEKPEELLLRLRKRRSDNPFNYLADALSGYELVENLDDETLRSVSMTALCFVLFTYRKLRKLLATAHQQLRDAEGNPLPDEAEDEKPGFFKRLGNFSKSKAVAVGAGIAAGAVALGKLVLPTSSFVSQVGDPSGCFRACQRMIGHNAPPGKGIKIAKGTGSNMTKLPGFDKGVDVIDQHLASGKPIIVGVDDKPGSVNRDGATDHFVVVVGSGKDDKGTYYQFFDPGTAHVDKGTSADNRFYADENGLFSGTSAYNQDSKRYTMTWVRPVA